MGKIRYAGIDAKIRAMGANGLKKQEYLYLVGLKNIEGVVNYLNEHGGYALSFEQYNASTSKRLDIEKDLNQYLLKDMQKIYSFASSREKKQMKEYFLCYEVEMLKLAVRMVFDHRKFAFPKSSYTDFLFKHSKVDFERLKSCTEISDVIASLEGTKYYKIFKDMEGYEDNLFEIEMRLENLYYSLIWKWSGTLKGKDKKIAQEIIGTQIDMMNIMYIYRGRNFYKLSSERLYTYLIPIQYKLGKHKLIAMVDAEDTEMLKKAVGETFYRKIFVPDDDATLERNFKEGLMKVYTEIEKQYPNSMAMVWSYLFFKKLEVDNLISIIEDAAYGTLAKNIMQYIIVPQ